MLGAIIGDIVGSIYEGKILRTKDFSLFSPKRYFTDDTVLTIAVADTIIYGGNYSQKLKEYCRKYPSAGYGLNFYNWGMSDDLEPYNSWGNGSAMRVSPVGFAFDDLDTVLVEAKRSADVTHNHPEGVKGAQATASAIFLGRKGGSKNEIKTYIETTFNYNLDQTVEEVKPAGISCKACVPEALIAFLESNNFEDAIRNAVFIGGDTDTIACITGGIAQAFYGEIPEEIAIEALNILDEPLLRVTKAFMAKYS